MSDMIDKEKQQQMKELADGMYYAVKNMTTDASKLRKEMERHISLLFNIIMRNDMKYHNEDIAACTNDKCKQKDTCLRWQLGTNKDPYQTYLDGDMCEGEFYVELKR